MTGGREALHQSTHLLCKHRATLAHCMGTKGLVLVSSFLTFFNFLLVKCLGSEFQLQDKCKEHVKSSFKQLLSKIIHFSGV